MGVYPPKAKTRVNAIKAKVMTLSLRELYKTQNHAPNSETAPK
jgi:hypothetical protein